MTELGPDWIADAEGVPRREAARAVIFSPQGEVLLFHGHDGHGREHHWWFTVGGGMEPGETPQECVIREVGEETGMCLVEEQLIGPVLYRQAEFRFLNVRARQDEWFFLVFLEQASDDFDFSNWTETENEVIDEYRWVGPAAMGDVAKGVPIYPLSLAELATKWWSGWDGVCLEIREYEESLSEEAPI